MRRLILLDAPSNLGLRPPRPGTVPGCYKLPWSLRDQGTLGRLGAVDGGAVVPPRYDRGDWQPGDGVFNGAAIAAYAGRLAARLAPLLDAGDVPIVLGGDCSILLGPALALRRRGRYGLAFCDGHPDFRHPGNSAAVGAAAGEDLALVTGRGQADLTDLDGLCPYVRDGDVTALGVHDEEESGEDGMMGEMGRLGMLCLTADEVRERGAGEAARLALARLEAPELDGFWIHLDADVLDPDVMPAVDSRDRGGLQHAELVELLGTLAGSPRAVGVDVTVFDPDLDPDGTLAAALADTLVAGIRKVVQ